MSGSDLSVSALETDCTPIVTNADMGMTVSYTGVPLIPSNAAIPCGLIAKSLFNDTYALYNVANNQSITIMTNNIAWPSDRDGRYKNVPNGANLQWINMQEDEHFMVWMRTAALPDFRKLWGRIEQNLPAGKYYYLINNSFNVTQFDGKKSIVLSTTNVFGGKNDFLAIAYIVVGVVCSLITIGFLVRKFLAKDKNN